MYRLRGELLIALTASSFRGRRQPRAHNRRPLRQLLRHLVAGQFRPGTRWRLFRVRALRNRFLERSGARMRYVSGHELLILYLTRVIGLINIVIVAAVRTLILLELRKLQELHFTHGREHLRLHDLCRRLVGSFVDLL